MLANALWYLMHVRYSSVTESLYKGATYMLGWQSGQCKIIGNIKLKVEDSDVLRYYPIIDSPTPTTTPAPTVATPVSLETGTILKRTLDKGVGILEIDNKVDSDSVISITRSSNPQESLLKVYIRAADKCIISDIPEGTYILYYMSGKDWNNTASKFNTITEISRFDPEFIYDSSGRGYSITLYTVEGGNAPTTNIPESEFPK